jgi:hypothetical protein
MAEAKARFRSLTKDSTPLGGGRKDAKQSAVSLSKKRPNLKARNGVSQAMMSANLLYSDGAIAMTPLERPTGSSP